MFRSVFLPACRVQFLGEEGEIDLVGHGEPEFSEFTWMDLDHLPERVRSRQLLLIRDM